jgi:hypothetical protein
MTMNNKLKFAFRTMLVLHFACLVASTGCSDIEATSENDRVTANLLINIERDNEKIENPRVHPGQPYNQGWWPDPEWGSGDRSRTDFYFRLEPVG